MNQLQCVPVLLQFAAVLAAQAATPAEPKTLPAAWQAAKAQAKQHKAPILAFVLPPAGAEASAESLKATQAAEVSVGMLVQKGGTTPPMLTTRDVLLRQVQLLRSSRHAQPRSEPTPSETQAILALTIPVFAAAADCEAKPGETVVLLGPDGKRVQGFALDLLDGSFARELGAVLMTPAAIGVRQANVPPSLDASLRRYQQLAKGTTDAGEIEEFSQLEAQLVANLPAVAPALLQFQDGQPQLGSALRLQGRRALLGTTDVQRTDDPCPPCGMGYTPPELNTVLKLIGP